jgi:ETC complex I subunit conserved region
MTARIYRPARTAMQSGTAKTREWVLDYEPEQPRTVEPLMGWTSSGDMKQQVRLHFETKEEAIAYCEQRGIAYQAFDSTPHKRVRMAYSDNFAYTRRSPWTH